MTFKEWFEDSYKEEWTDDRTLLYTVSVEYEEFCHRNKITPVWDS